MLRSGWCERLHKIINTRLTFGIATTTKKDERIGERLNNIEWKRKECRRNSGNKTLTARLEEGTELISSLNTIVERNN